MPASTQYPKTRAEFSFIDDLISFHISVQSDENVELDEIKRRVIEAVNSTQFQFHVYHFTLEQVANP